MDKLFINVILIPILFIITVFGAVKWLFASDLTTEQIKGLKRERNY